MPKFMVYAFCDECLLPHPMGVILNLADGPVEITTVGEVFRDQRVPREVAILTDNQTQCPKTRRLYTQQDLERVYLSRLAR